MIDKKAAYESLLLETAVSSSDTLGSSLTVNVASSPLAQSGNGAGTIIIPSSFSVYVITANMHFYSYISFQYEGMTRLVILL